MDFNELVKQNKQNVKSIIRLITKQENEDLEQEVFIKAWKGKSQYEERGTFKSWINTIAANVAKDYLKSAWFKNTQNSTNDDFTLNSVKDKKITPEESAISIERRGKIISAIDSLKPKMKEVIILCEMEGYTYEEASKKLHCPIGTIKSRIFNAKKELMDKLEELI